MEILFISRLQFATTTVFHFLFVPLTLGLGLFVAMLETMRFRNQSSEYKLLLGFWSRFFLVGFAMGVVTGIVQEFQIGMNWSEYSRFMGDVLGAPFAMEALLAFFLQSTSLGLWIFGRSVLPSIVHLACIWVVAIASCLSAVWIVMANSFMQHPVGYIYKGARVEMTSFFDIVCNPYFIYQFFHVLGSGVSTAAFFVLGVSAWRIRLRGKDIDLFKTSFRFALWAGVLGMLLIFLSGHLQRQSIAVLQPMKLAAMENLNVTQDPAPFSVVPGIELPALLSLAIYNEPRGEIKGMEDLQNEYAKRYGSGDYTPPVALVYISFRVMVLCACSMLFLALYAFIRIYFMHQSLSNNVLLVFVIAISFPFLSNTFGWIVAEVGRQPWAVYNLMKIENAVSEGVSFESVMFSFVSFTIVYGILTAATVYLFCREAKAGIVFESATRKNMVVNNEL